jgi:iron complex outermembrane receptor protein
MKTTSAAVTCAITSVLTLCASAAQAGDEVAATAAETTDTLETVIVTARRREENLERVPASITALNSQQLAEQGIVSEADLQAAVPGLTVRQTQGSNSLTFAIRGQTIDAFTGSKTAVIPYFDEVQLNTGGASTFFDLESIQVLKGPQGTLFGRNATGGAVLYTSIKPKNDLEGYATVRAGAYGLVEGLGAINIPLISDKVLLRVAGDVIHQDGYQHNLFNGKYQGEINRQNGRVSLLVRPIEGLENSLVVDIDHSGGNSTATRLSAVNRVNPTTFACVNPKVATCASDLLFSPLVDNIYAPGTWAAYVAAHPYVNPNGIAAYLEQNASQLGFLQADDASPVFHNEQDYFLANTTTYEFDEDLRLKNIFGVSDANTHDLGSSVGAPYLVFTSENLATGERGNHVEALTFSDELQLQGKTLDRALTYIIGAYYQSEDTKTLFPQVYFDLSPLGPPSNVDNHFEIKDRSPALFAQGTYDFTSLGLKGLSFTGGFRYTWETTDITQLSGSVFLSDPAQAAYQSTRYSNPGWTLGLSYQATDELMLYVEGRRSWRAGGFNGTAPPFVSGIASITNLFKPESTIDAEIGAKYSGSVLDHPLRFNLALYDQWIDNVQRAEFPVPPGRAQSIAYTVNVPKAEVSGVELDAAFKPISWLEIGVTGDLTDARFLSGHDQAVVFGTLYTFGPYADAPKATGSVYANVLLPAPSDWGSMNFRADLFAQKYMYFSNNNDSITPNTRIPGYALLNLRYDWKDLFGSKLSVAGYVRNVTDKEYYTGGFALTASLGVNSVAIGTPRMFGAEINYSF